MIRSLTVSIKSYYKSVIMVLAIIITSYGFISFSFGIAFRMTTLYTPMQNAMLNLQVEATKAHLWFEEIISGDETEKYVTVEHHIDAAIGYARVLLDGGDLKQTRYLAVEDPGVESDLRYILNQLLSFQQIIQKRYAHAATSGIGSSYDQQLDAHFANLIKRSNLVIDKLASVISREQHTYRLSYYWSLTTVFFIIIALAALYFWYERDRHQKERFLQQQSRLAAMGEMVGNIAHQWRQPLNSLGLILQKLPLLQERGKLTDEKLTASVANGMDLIHNMSQTIDDFRYFFSHNRGKSQLLLQEVIDEALTITSALFSKNRILHEVKVSDPDLMQKSFPGELTQVLVNLLHNAIDAFEEHPPAQAKVVVEIYKEQNNLCTVVSDNAGGIPQTVISKIFDPYFSTKEEGKGTGIGLYMSKVIVEEHIKGELHAVNTQDGASFIIRLPLAQ